MSDIVSKHIFTFPFKWESKRNNKNKLNYFEDVLKESNYNWLRIEHILNRDSIDVGYKDIKTGTKKDRNMVVPEKVKLQNTLEYYYPEVKKIMFDFRDEKEFLRCYELDFESGIYIIQAKDNCKYELDLEKIILKVYPTGVALLSYFLNNKTYKKPKEILEINQVGRRIKWPYVGEEKSKIKYDASSESIGTSPVALSIRIKAMDLPDIVGNFGQFIKTRSDEDKNFNKAYILPINSIVTELLGKGFLRSDDVDDDKISYDLVIDDRMHVISYYFNDEIFSEENKRFFYEYTFVDSKNDAFKLTASFMNDLIDKNSYQRWHSHNYGISNYSFVCHGVRDWFNENIISTHIEGLYYEMIAIHLMQKASLQKFSSDLSKINSLKEFQKIQKSYLDFIADYCYGDLTAQEQGIELYDMVKKITGISEKIEQVNSKINRLVDFYKQENDAKSNLKMNVLTVMVGVLGLFSYYESIKTTEIRFSWQGGLIGEVIKIDDTFNYLRQIRLSDILLLIIYFSLFSSILVLIKYVKDNK